MKWFKEVGNISDLRNTYKKLLVRYHPDNNPDTDTTRIMQEINSEYNALLKRFQQSDGCKETVSEEALKAVLYEVVKLKANITIEVIGTWIWIQGNAYPVKGRLKELGFRWAPKKGMWCWGTMAHSCRTTMEMSYIRQKYGSTVYRHEEKPEGIKNKNMA